MAALFLAADPAHSQAVIVHHFSPKATLLEHGDTLRIAVERPDSAKAAARVTKARMDTVVLLPQGQAMFMLAGGKRNPVSQFWVKQVNMMLGVAGIDEKRRAAPCNGVLAGWREE